MNTRGNGTWAVAAWLTPFDVLDNSHLGHWHGFVVQLLYLFLSFFININAAGRDKLLLFRTRGRTVLWALLGRKKYRSRWLLLAVGL